MSITNPTKPQQATPPATRTRRRRENTLIKALPYLLPSVALYLFFLVYPMLDAVRLSFFDWTGFRTDEPEWVGLDNYVRTFTADPVFYTALKNSVIWVVLSLLIPMMLGLLLALALNRRMVGRNLFRSVFYIPAVFASITVAAMWRWIYNPNVGSLNQVLESLGLSFLQQEWLGDPKLALYSVFIASIWQGVGFSLVLFLAGLQQVPAELIDAAKVDGANRWQIFKAVTVPALQPTTAVVVILTIINSLKVYDLIVGMTGGGPAQSTQVLALWSYQQSITNHDFGQGGAVATVLLVLSLCLVVPYLVRTLKAEEH